MGNVKKYDPQVTINAISLIAITEGLLYGLNSSGNPVLASRSVGPQAAVGFAVKGLTSTEATQNRATALATQGIIELATTEIAGGAFTVGAQVWLDVTGFYTTTKPTTATQILQSVGWAMSATKVAVHIGPAHVIVAAASGTLT